MVLGVGKHEVPSDMNGGRPRNQNGLLEQVRSDQIARNNPSLAHRSVEFATLPAYVSVGDIRAAFGGKSIAQICALSGAALAAGLGALSGTKKTSAAELSANIGGSAGKIHRAIAGAILKGDSVDDSDIPAKALKTIGEWTDTTQLYGKTQAGRQDIYIHVDDMLAGNGKDEGFIASNASGKLLASGSYNTDSQGNAVSGSFRFDNPPQA